MSTFLALQFIPNLMAYCKNVPNADIKYSNLDSFKQDWNYAISDPKMVDENFYKDHVYYFPNVPNYTNNQNLLDNLHIERISYALHWFSPDSNSENFIDYKLANHLHIHPANKYSICYCFDLHLLGITDQKKFISAVRTNQNLFNNIPNDIYQSIVTEINDTRKANKFNPLTFGDNTSTTTLYFNTGHGQTHKIINDASKQSNLLADRSITLHDSGFSFPSHRDGSNCSISSSCSRVLDIIGNSCVNGDSLSQSLPNQPTSSVGTPTHNVITEQPVQTELQKQNAAKWATFTIGTPTHTVITKQPVQTELQKQNAAKWATFTIGTPTHK